MSFGGGVNSTAMLLLLEEQARLPDLVLFADTGGERPETYRHVGFMSSWCGERGVPFVTVSIASHERGACLEDICLRRKELPSLAYGFKGCSVKWKRQPMDRYIRDEWPPAKAAWARGELVDRLIGIDAGETQRTKLPPDDRYRYVYPLVDAGLDRDGCLELIAEHGIEQPPKSSCFFCPAMRKEEILALSEDHPDLFARAVAMEDNAIAHTVRGLGRDWRWRDFVAADKRQGKLFAPAPPCDCMDEDDA
jgi:hypothetical protein